MRKTIWLTPILALTLGAQEPNPAQKLAGAKDVEEKPTPIYHVNVVARTTKAVNYRRGAGPTKIGFQGTILLPQASGEARIESKKGAIEIQARFKDLQPPTRYGRQYLTYVLWAITPEGRATNLGEVLTNHKDKGNLRATTELQTFALVVTAEPYFAVTQPSDVVVIENIVLPETLGNVQTVDAKYELLKRGQYTYRVDDAAGNSAEGAKKISLDRYEALLELYQARNAVQLAKSQGAEQYASDSFQKAQQYLNEAEGHYAQKAKGKVVVTVARQAAQTAEDARLITLRKKEAEQETNAL